MNRNRKAFEEIQRALEPKQTQPKKYNVEHDLHASKEYKVLASHGDQSSIFSSQCTGCMLAKWCSACVLVGWIITPKQCKAAKKVVAEEVLNKILPKVTFKVTGAKNG